jgi:uncharacterized protein with PIN domain
VLAAAELRFYLDEHLHVEIARQLKRLGIDVITVTDVESFGEDDLIQLRRAIRMGRVFCTNDSDLIEIASEGIKHKGIVFGQQEKHFIGTWVKYLTKLHEDFRPDELVNLVSYVSTVE